MRGQLVAVGLFAAVTAGLVAGYWRAFGGDGAEAAAGGAPGSTSTAGKRHPGRVEQFHAELREKYGKNARGLPVVVAVDYDEFGDRLHVVLSLDHTLDQPAEARAAGLRRILGVLQLFDAAGLNCTSILVTATAPVPGRDGHTSEAMVIRCQFPREKLSGVEWQRLTGQDVAALAEQFWLHPELEERAASEGATGAAQEPAQ